MQKKLIFWNSEITGTTLKHLKKGILQEHLVLLPDQKTLEKFNSICEDIQLKIEKLTKKIENSERIRDKLLDKLFSQKVKISY
ncbi:restriction endonuclease subunit S [Mycoplasma suis]|uniref:restriction endonuclease subunit S n=1 Tax=Mycoplasma suis TaxID=57372 RepID=UPI000305BC81|nr:restriction endonuclease subunit S [Mycoplasma suis]